MARTAGQKTKAANGPTTDPPAESIDQVRDLLFGGQMRMVDARLQGLEQRMQNENAAVRAELDRQVATLDDSIRKELARHAERLASERTKRGEDLKALGADLKEALKGLERRHQSLEETAGLADAELRDHLLKQSAAFSGELARTAERLSESSIESLPSYSRRSSTRRRLSRGSRIWPENSSAAVVQPPVPPAVHPHLHRASERRAPDR